MLSSAPSAAVLQTILRRESRSLFQYVREAYPWTTANARATLVELDRLIDEEAAATASLGRFLLKHHIPLPYLGAYPSHFTNVNYIGLDFLMPKLVEQQREAIAALGHDLNALSDEESRKQVLPILEMKRRHLKKLEELAAPVAA
jgi:hypothetical protein